MSVPKVLDEVDGALHRLETWQGELQKMHGLNRQLLKEICTGFTGYGRGYCTQHPRERAHTIWWHCTEARSKVSCDRFGSCTSCRWRKPGSLAA